MLNANALSVKVPLCALAVVGALGVLSGCTQSSDDADLGSVSPSATTAAEIATFDASGMNGYDLALNTGTLEAVGNCVALDNGTVLVFPEGTAAWDGETLSFAGAEFRLGDAVSATGSLMTSQQAANIPSDCSEHQAWGVGALELRTP